MRKAIIAAFLLLLCSIVFIDEIEKFYPHTLSPQAQTALESCDIAKNKNNVFVIAGSARGSAWWVKTDLGDEYFVTNAHVVMPEDESVVPQSHESLTPYVSQHIRLMNNDGLLAVAEVVAIINSNSFQTRRLFNIETVIHNTYFDVAILKVTHQEKGFYENLSQLELSERNTGEIGAVSGYVPHNNTMVKHSKCLPIAHGEDISVLLSDGEQAIHGQSGSAVLNESNQVVGLLTSINAPDYSMNVYRGLSKLSGNSVFFYESEKTENSYAFVTPVRFIHIALKMAKERETYHANHE